MTDDKAEKSDTPEHSDEDTSENNSKIEAERTEILEKPPEELRTVLQALHVQEEYFQGPLPRPATLKEYEDILSGSADRIITMAEKQQQHRMEMEHAVIHSDIVMERLGLATGFILAVILAIGGIWLVSEGKELTGLIVLVGEIAALVGAFLFGQRRRQRELDERKKALEEGPAESIQPPSDLSET